MNAPSRPQVLCLSGHDPTGGAGIHADIETCAALGAHALTIVTAHTVQDTRDVRRVSAVAPILLAAQLDALLEDCSPRAAKLGLLGDAAQIPVIVQRLTSLRKPVVLDPILRAGGGRNLVGADLQAAVIQTLFPVVDLLTPNADEARRLTGREDLEACGAALLERGPKQVLITGGDERSDAVVNILFSRDAEPRRWSWPRLPETFHGAGCTLAAAVAALLACGKSSLQAIEQAQHYVDEALRRAYAVGGGRRLPGRLPPTAS